MRPFGLLCHNFGYCLLGKCYYSFNRFSLMDLDIYLPHHVRLCLTIIGIGVKVCDNIGTLDTNYCAMVCKKCRDKFVC